MSELGENRIISKRLREVASKLTRDLELQKDLLQEMCVNLYRVQKDRPNQTLAWYIKNCEYHARNYLKLGRSIDSQKRSHSRVYPDREDGSNDHDHFQTVSGFAVEGIATASPQAELITSDLCERIAPRLSEMQQRIVSLLLQDFGVREIARKLGISHPAVIKHRKKIAKIGRKLLDDAFSTGPDDFSNGHRNPEPGNGSH